MTQSRIRGLDLAGGDDPRSAALLALAMDGCRSAGATVARVAIRTRSGVRVRSGEFDDAAVASLAQALVGAGGILLSLPGDQDALADLIEEALIALTDVGQVDRGPLERTVVGLLGVGGERTGDLSLVDRAWEALTEAGALVLPGAVIVDASTRSFDADGMPRNDRHREAAREVGASVARLVRRMGL
jgi:hypothetical protein